MQRGLDPCNHAGSQILHSSDLIVCDEPQVIERVFACQGTFFRFHRFNRAEHRIDGLVSTDVIVHVEAERVRPAGPRTALASRAVHKKLEPRKMHQFGVFAPIAIPLEDVQTEKGVCVVDPQREQAFALQLP